MLNKVDFCSYLVGHYNTDFPAEHLLTNTQTIFVRDLIETFNIDKIDIAAMITPRDFAHPTAMESPRSRIYSVPIDPPPAIIHADFSSFTAKQLRAAQEEVWAWITEAESASYDDAPDDDILDEAREALNEIISERRDLHGDETAPRGG